jgi:hypothetical protein
MLQYTCKGHGTITKKHPILYLHPNDKVCFPRHPAAERTAYTSVLKSVGPPDHRPAVR